MHLLRRRARSAGTKAEGSLAVGLKPYHLECGKGDARHSEAFREDDRRRRWELDRRLREDGYCRYCRKKLNEDLMERTPGVCGDKECRKRKMRGEP